MEHQPIIEAVQMAGDLCQRVQRDFRAENIKGGEPVTIADYGAQALIGRALQQAFPDDAVIAEEHAEQFLTIVPPEQRRQILHLLEETLQMTLHEDDLTGWLDQGQGRTAPRTWVIDPVDGTESFLQGTSYSICVGVLEEWQPRGAVLACPHSNAIYSCWQGQQPQRLTISDGTRQPMHVSSRNHDLRIVESPMSHHVDQALQQQVYAALGENRISQIHAQVKYALIADGSADLYVRIANDRLYQAKIWDHAAGVALVLAAGGQVTDELGQPLDFSQGFQLPLNFAIVVSNAVVQERVLAAIQRFIP